MPYRHLIFQDESFYHVFNRGVNKQPIFSSHADYRRLQEILCYYQVINPKPSFSTHKRFKLRDYSDFPKIVEIVSYCFMPNHFHLLLRQISNGGVQEHMRKTLNSYTKYFNTKYKRIGPLFQGEFKAVPVESDEQLLHLSRYIHLNPYVGGLCDNLSSFQYSSYHEFVDSSPNSICNTAYILHAFPSKQAYKRFLDDHKDYAKELDTIKHLTFE